MKLAHIVAAAAQAKNSSWLKKEWEVQDAYFANEKIILSDPTLREGSKRQYKIELRTAHIIWAILLILYCSYELYHIIWNKYYAK